MRASPHSTAWVAQKEDERKTLISAMQQQRMQEWIEGLRKAAKIVDRRKQLFAPQGAS